MFSRAFGSVDPWDMFCRDKDTSHLNRCGRVCSGSVSVSLLESLVVPTACARHAVLAGIILLLLFVFLVLLVRTKCLFIPDPLGKICNNSHAESNALLAKVCFGAAVICGIASLGIALGIGVWRLDDKEEVPLHEVVMLLVQGVLWLVMATTVKLRVNHRVNTFLRIWWILTFTLASIEGIFSALDIWAVKGWKIARVCSLVAWTPGCLYLILSLRSSGADFVCARKEGLEEALLKERTSFCENENVFCESSENVTRFASAGVFSRAAFLWLNSLLKEGYTRPLQQEDVPNLGPYDTSEQAGAKFAEEWREQQDADLGRHPTVQSVLVAVYWKKLVGTGVIAALSIITILLGPVLLNVFLKYLSGIRYFSFDGYFIVLSLFVAKVTGSLAEKQLDFKSKRLGMHLRSSVIGAIYRKVLSLSNAGRQKHSTGEIVNYMLADARRIGEAPELFHQLWTTPLQITVALIILALTVQWATIAGLVALLLMMLLNVPLTTAETRCVKRLMAAQDSRMQATSEALRNMKILKLQGWELRFKEEIGKLREDELKWLRACQIHRALKSFMFWMTPIFIVVSTFLTCVLLSIPLDASNVFTSLATLRIIQKPIRYFPVVVAAIIQAQVAMARITDFLSERDLQANAVERSLPGEDGVAVKMQNAVMGWDIPALKILNMVVRVGDHVAVCGAVGSGKSTLLYSILGEIQRLSGEVRVSGSIAYVPQTAWIQSGTIRDNILFGKTMDQNRYDEIIKACALDSDIQSLDYGDLTEIGERGLNLSGGQKQRIQLARAVYQDADIYLLDDPFSAVDAQTGATIFKTCIRRCLLKKTVIMVTHQVEFLPAVDMILLLKGGKILQAGTYKELANTGSAFADLLSAHDHTMNQYSEGLAGLSFERKKAASRSELESQVGDTWRNTVQLIKDEEQEIGDTGWAPYVEYLSQANGFFYCSASVLFVVIFLVGQVSSNWWMAVQLENSEITMAYLVGIYSIISLSSGWFLALRTVSSVFMGMDTSKVLYFRFMNSIFSSPMSFFDSTPLGRILSRLSSDLQILDTEIPGTFGWTISSTMNAWTTLAVTAVVTWQTLILVVPILLINTWLQNFYLSSARQLMRINATTKSPVANHLSETIAGAMTIRAFRRQEEFKKRNEEHVDLNSASLFHAVAAADWLTLRLDFLCISLLCLCAFIIVLLPAGTIEPGFAGLVLTYGLSLNMLMVAGVTSQCTLANQIISMERLEQYMYNEPEAPVVIQSSRPFEQWPTEGTIELHNLQVRYRPNTPLILKRITCRVEGGKRVGIVGRTGSGKTTLISSLFRLVEASAGKITIDGCDISTIGLHDLRSKLSIIPQEPALFRGSIRFNVDPLGDFTDAEIWRVLEKCQLGDIVRSKDEKLDYIVTDDGENWSAGQRQLFCLGRVLLRRNRVLVLDEATASIDNYTDAVLQSLMREEFQDSTVITVAHRIPSVIDSDMVMTLNDGLLVEYDKPVKLLEDVSSHFARLVAEYRSHSKTR